MVSSLSASEPHHFQLWARRTAKALGFGSEKALVGVAVAAPVVLFLAVKALGFSRVLFLSIPVAVLGGLVYAERELGKEE